MPQSNNPLCFDSMITYKFVDIIANEKMEPNIITISNIIPSFLSLYFLYHHNYVLFIIFLVIRLILDCLDGHVARKYNKITNFGNKLDHYTDLIFYIILIILLTSKFNIIIIIIIVTIFIIIIERHYIPILSELFQIIEDNSVIMVPLISIILINL